MAIRERRSIEKTLFSPGSRKFFRLKTDKTRLLYIGFLLVADDLGYLDADPEELVALFPKMDMTIRDVKKCVADMIQVGLIIEHTQNDVKYLEINNFVEKQDWHSIGARGSKFTPNSDEVSPPLRPPTTMVADNHNKSATAPEVMVGSVFSSKTKPSTEVVADGQQVFKQAKSLFRRYVGKSFGSIGNMGYRWEEFVGQAGSYDTAVLALEIYCRELGKGGRNLNYPLAHFLKNYPEFIEAARIQSEQDTLVHKMNQQTDDLLTKIELDNQIEIEKLDRELEAKRKEREDAFAHADEI